MLWVVYDNVMLHAVTMIQRHRKSWKAPNKRRSFFSRSENPNATLFAFIPNFACFLRSPNARKLPKWYTAGKRNQPMLFSTLRGIFVFLLTFGPTLLAREHKPVLRALVACDLIANNIKEGSTADFIRMKRNLSLIAKELGIPSRITAPRRGSLSTQKIQKWLSSLRKNSNDIVVFYFSGHGGRVSQSQGQWPFIICSKRDIRKRAQVLMGKAICNRISKKKPRLAIIMFDSCNNQIYQKALQEESSQTALDVTPSMLPQLQKLFLQSRGVVIASAASPGEIAVTSVQGPLSGGIFTTGFLFSLKYYAQDQNATWNDVFLGTSLFCRRFYQGKQNPQYRVSDS